MTRLFFTGLYLFFSLLLQAHANTKKPNIIFVLSNDQPYGYLGVTGNPIAKTSNLDKLANQGMLFTNTLVTSAICTPSRASILLGQYECKHGGNFNLSTSVAKEAWQHSYPCINESSQILQ
ncbi:sulfatase-like hydrolase/transferase [Thalassotalea sp. PLHSN55]|uniref:sulfatase-like hydrolase/transferase n=1 Tax=Thalassotalea sp. PLHSN55 TaxID=3435888 RepID=UPI003F83C440